MRQIKVLGTGCPKCQKLAELVMKVANEQELDVNLEKVTDITQIAEYGMVATPALVVDGKIVSSRNLPSIEELTNALA